MEVSVRWKGLLILQQKMEAHRLSESENQRDSMESLFMLKKWSESAQTSVSISVDFSGGSKQGLPSEGSLRSLPVFNNDQKYYTPAFIVQLDLPKYRAHEHLYLALHNRKAAEVQEQKTDMFIPKPSDANKYCCVCRAPFQNYLAHLHTPKHLTLMRASKCHQHIQDLCDSYRTKPPITPPKTKPICKNLKKGVLTARS